MDSCNSRDQSECICFSYFRISVRHFSAISELCQRLHFMSEDNIHERQNDWILICDIRNWLHNATQIMIN